MSERFRVGLKTGDRILIEGVIDKNARYVFTHGYCSELAHACMSALMGWLSGGARTARRLDPR